MEKLKMYCLCLHNKHFHTVKKLGYIPVGLGKGFFSPEWLRDNEKRHAITILCDRGERYFSCL